MIHIIPSLKITSKGLTSSGQEILLSQGDMDGACTIYSLMMALQILRLTTRSDATNIWKRIKASTSKGKLIRAFMEKEGFARGGLRIDKVCETLNSCMGSKIIGTYYNLKNEEDRDSIIKQEIDKGLPALIGISYNAKSGHSLTAIGYEDDSRGYLSNLFCLDPNSPKTDIGYWNSIISLNESTGKYKDFYYPQNTKVIVDECITFQKR